MFCLLSSSQDDLQRSWGISKDSRLVDREKSHTGHQESVPRPLGTVRKPLYTLGNVDSVTIDLSDDRKSPSLCLFDLLDVSLPGGVESFDSGRGGLR